MIGVQNFELPLLKVKNGIIPVGYIILWFGYLFYGSKF
jgi:hypothetical protein